MQLFSADATIFKKRNFAPQNIEKLSSKVAHNPTRPASFCFEQWFYMSEIFSSWKLSNFAGWKNTLRIALLRYLNK